MMNPAQEQEKAQETDPYDTSKDRAELEALKLELEQNSASLEGDFAKYVSTNLTPEQEELMLEDKEKFIKDVLLPMQNKFYNEKIGSKEARVGELEKSMHLKENHKAFDSAVNTFLETSKMDKEQFNAMMDFYQEDLPKRKQQELEKLPPNEFFKELYAIYSKEDKQDQKLPMQLKGVANSAIDDNLGTDEVPMDRV